MKTPKKKQPVKARKMWALQFRGVLQSNGPGIYTFDDSAKAKAHATSPVVPVPILIPPATQEAYDAMAYQVCREVFCNPGTLWMKLDKSDRVGLLKRSEQILASLGITKPASDAWREEGKTL